MAKTALESNYWKLNNSVSEYGSKKDIIENLWLVSNDLDAIRGLFVQKGIDLKGTDIIQRLGLDMKYLDWLERKINAL